MAEQAAKKKSGVEKTRDTVAQVFNQAKESLRVLQALEKETFEKARNFVKFPSQSERKRMTNTRILNSLKKLGVATRAEVEALEEKLRKLENILSHNESSSASHHSHHSTSEKNK